MQHTGLVDGRQPVGQGRAQGAHRFRRQRAVRLHRLAQVEAGQVGGGQPGLGRVRVVVQHRRDVGGVDAADGGDLPEEAVATILAAREPRVDDLHRDQVAGRGAAQENASHAARPQPTDQAVPGDTCRIVRAQRLHPVLRLS